MNIALFKKPLFAFAAAVASCMQFASEVHGAMAELQHAAEPPVECHHHPEYEYDTYDGEE